MGGDRQGAFQRGRGYLKAVLGLSVVPGLPDGRSEIPVTENKQTNKEKKTDFRSSSANGHTRGSDSQRTLKLGSGLGSEQT